MQAVAGNTTTTRGSGNCRFQGRTLDEFPRVKLLRERLLGTPVRVCVERARLLTQFLRSEGERYDSPHLRYAAAVRHVLVNKRACIPDQSLIAGTTTAHDVGAPVYPEFTGLTIWPELDSISTRKRNPQLLDPADARELDREIFPYWMDRTILEETRKEFGNPSCLKLFEQLVYFIAGKAGCISHTVPFYRHVLTAGTAELRRQAVTGMERLAEATDDDSRRRSVFYRSVDMVLEGVETYAAHLSDEASTLAASTGDPVRKGELETLAAICSRVPRSGATTLHEAVNSLWILQVCIHAENINMAMSPGRLDQLLYPFYRSDIDHAVIDTSEAFELLACLWLRFNDNVCLVPESSEELFGGAGTVPAVTIGGVDEHGKDAVNECTWMLLHVAELLRTRDPSLNARYYPGVNPVTYRNRLAATIAGTKCIPAVYNDRAAIATLRNQGISLPHARDYAIVGCVELAAAGRSYDASSSIILNLPAAVELLLFNGKRPSVSGTVQIGPQSGDPGSFTTFRQLWDAFTEQLGWLAGQAIELNGYLGTIHRKRQPSPLLSALFDGPLEQGSDLVDGGARYNSSGATHIGFADTVDSLCSLRYTVFEKNYCSMGEMIDAVEHNFDNRAALQLYCTNNAPKFGTEQPMALELSRKLAEFLYNFYQQHTNGRGGRYRPAYWSMTNHAGQGALAGALPSGRKAGMPFASGMTPSAGAASALTECCNAVSSIDGRYLPGGMALNLKYPVVRTARDVRRLAQVIEGYCLSGGMHIQCNIMSRQMLIDAKKKPFRYPWLLVRVSGYSAYFADLTPSMQDEIINRTAYDITSGTITDGPETMSPEEEHHVPLS